ncbi:MAG: GMP synthase [Ignavibacteria bacterium]|nr:GMP synthase [Ignavibacteria bacterium]MBT8383196.1 GMP synthase [Ignavibacteria bacterium]MBT8392537.1 GMP synthase [Ignavibacteria bacterium]NNL21743.1 GMP synthase [Ignavibacteriaceae bacterium]
MRNYQLKIATIDLYNNEKNEGMRCIHEIVSDVQSKSNGTEIKYEVFDTRFKGEIPKLNKDIYISSGGPGSPFEGEGDKWEKEYFNLIEKIWNHNQGNPDRKKYLFFICHSFQMMGRYFKFGNVNERHSKSFGVMPFSLTADGKSDIIFGGLSNPFYAADIRQFQVINPDEKKISELGAKILAYEIVDDNETAEPALGSVRISNEIVGTQFHPEADPESMLYHFKQDERKKQVVEKYGEERYDEMITILKKPDTIKKTRSTVIPSFLNHAIDKLTAVLSK